MPFAPSKAARENETELWDPQERCSLSVYPDYIARYQGRVGIVDLRQKISLVVTSRSADFYRNGYKDAVSDFRLRDETGPVVIEVGTGLSGYLPDLVERHPDVAATAIDPVDYAWLKDRLAAAAEMPAVQALGERVLADIQELIVRCDAYRSARIRHIQTPLNEALEQHGAQLHEAADAVIDSFGASFYSTGDNPDVSLRTMCEMLGPNGRFYSWRRDAWKILSDMHYEKSKKTLIS